MFKLLAVLKTAWNVQEEELSNVKNVLIRLMYINLNYLTAIKFAQLIVIVVRLKMTPRKLVCVQKAHLKTHLTRIP